MKIDTSTISIESQIESLALEAEFLSNVKSMFTSILPSITSKLKDSSILDYYFLTPIVKDSVNTFKELQPKLSHVQFTTYSKTIVPVPEGFNGKTLDYLKLLNTLATHIHSDVINMLGIFNTGLAAFISNKDAKTSFIDNTHTYVQIDKQREALVKELGSYFDKRNKSRVYLEDIIDRFSDMGAMVDELKTLDKTLSGQKIETISKELNKAVSMLDIVIDRLKDGSIVEVSGPASMNISKGAYSIGKYVEFISLFRYDTTVAFNTINRVLQQLNNVIK